MSVCLLVTFASCAKTAEPIEMSFGMLSRVGPRNHVLHGGADVARGKGHFCGLSAPLKSIGNICYSVRKNGWIDRDAVCGADSREPKDHVIDVVKVGRIHYSPLLGVTRQRCGLSSKRFDRLFTADAYTETVDGMEMTDENRKDGHVITNGALYAEVIPPSQRVPVQHTSAAAAANDAAKLQLPSVSGTILTPACIFSVRANVSIWTRDIALRLLVVNFESGLSILYNRTVFRSHHRPF